MDNTERERIQEQRRQIEVMVTAQVLALARVMVVEDILKNNNAGDRISEAIREIDRHRIDIMLKLFPPPLPMPLSEP